MSVCVGTFFDEVDKNMERLGAAIPKDAQGSGGKCWTWIGKLAAASALNPATPATAVVGSAGVIPSAATAN